MGEVECRGYGPGLPQETSWPGALEENSKTKIS